MRRVPWMESRFVHSKEGIHGEAYIVSSYTCFIRKL